MTPHSSAGGAERSWPEDLQMELGWPVGELHDAFDACEVECGVELTEVARHFVPLGGGRRERSIATLLMAVEVGEFSTGLGLEPAVLDEASTGGVDFVGCFADGGLVASWPAPTELVVEHALAVGEPLCSIARGSSPST